MLLVANLTKTKWYENLEKWLKSWNMGSHMGVLSECYPMNTNVTGFRWFSKVFASLCLGLKSCSLSLKRVNKVIFNPSNAEAIFIQSIGTQLFFENHLNLYDRISIIFQDFRIILCWSKLQPAAWGLKCHRSSQHWPGFPGMNGLKSGMNG